VSLKILEWQSRRAVLRKRHSNTIEVTLAKSPSRGQRCTLVRTVSGIYQTLRLPELLKRNLSVSKKKTSIGKIGFHRISLHASKLFRSLAGIKRAHTEATINDTRDITSPLEQPPTIVQTI
jgi:hypothetical protein